MKAPEVETGFGASRMPPPNAGGEFERQPTSADAAHHETGDSKPLRELFREELSRKLEATRSEITTSNSLQLLLHLDVPTAVKLRNTNHPQRSNREPNRQSFAAYFEEILVNPKFANAVFKRRNNPRVNEGFNDAVNMVGLARHSALEANRQSQDNVQLAANKSELSELDSAAKYIVIATAGVLTVAGEMHHWRLGATDPRNPDATMLFQLHTTNSRLHFIDLGDPQTALQLALNHTELTD